MAPNNALKKSALGGEAESESAAAPAAAQGGENAPRGVISASEVRSRGDGVNKGQSRDQGAARDELRRFLVACMFLTRLPMPRWVDHSPVDLVPGMMYFPVIGSLVGLWAGVWFEALATMWDPLVAAAGSTLMAVWLTGCFHEDGLADTLDSFGGGWGRAQILRIMKDSRVGTYAVVGVSLCMISKTALIAGFGSPAATIVALTVAHSWARLPSVWLVTLFPYVHDEGDDKGLLYNSFAGCLAAGLLTWRRVLASTAYVAFVCVALLEPLRAAMLLCLLPVVVLSAGFYAKGVIGGVIGDFLGATIMLSELLAYMVLCARLPADFADPAFAVPWLRLIAVVSLPTMLMRGAGDLPNKSC